MQISDGYKNFNKKSGAVITLGMFDGVHLGHKAILEKVCTEAKETNSKSVVLTFWPHPRLVFDSGADLQLLTTIEEKTDLLERLGIDHLIIQNFDEEFRNLSGGEFVKQVLLKSLGVQHLIIGYDHVFGKNKTGNFELLKKMSVENGFTVEQIEAIDLENQHISSTKIRNALAHGRIGEANTMLGYSYTVTGSVIHGQKLGRTIGYPTANLQVDSLKMLPKKGAYIVEVELHSYKHKGMLSIGTNPTVGGTHLSVEVYILDFDQDIYGCTITVHFRDFLHDEIKFESLEKLIERLDEDKKITENYPF